MSICVEVFVWTCVFTSLGHVSRNRILGHMETLCLTFCETAKLFSKVVASFYNSMNNSWSFQFLCILASTCYWLCVCFFLSNPSGYEVVSMVLICISPTDVEHSLGEYLLGEMVIQILCLGYLSFNGGFPSPLYILHSRHLSDIRFVNIFSFSVDCLFTPLTVCFF